MSPLNTHKDLVYVIVEEFFFDPLVRRNEDSTFLREILTDFA